METPEKIPASTAWGRANRERKRAINRAWYQRNKIRARAQHAIRQEIWRERNPDKARAWAKANPDKARSHALAWYYRDRVRTVAGPEILADFKAWEAKLDQSTKRMGAKAIKAVRDV